MKITISQVYYATVGKSQYFYPNFYTCKT